MRAHASARLRHASTQRASEKSRTALTGGPTLYTYVLSMVQFVQLHHYIYIVAKKKKDRSVLYTCGMFIRYIPHLVHSTCVHYKACARVYMSSIFHINLKRPSECGQLLSRCYIGWQGCYYTFGKYFCVTVKHITASL